MALLSSFMKDKMVASVIPTSNGAVMKIISSIDFSKDIVIVEYGAGTGVITKALLDRMSSGSRLVAFERNAELCSSIGITDSRLELVNDGCEKVKEYVGQADYVVSGVPMSLWSNEQKELVVRESKDLLRDGVFLVYQTSTHVKPLLEKHFANVKVGRALVNLPPLVIMEAKA